jgi:hypothetical protein
VCRERRRPLLDLTIECERRLEVEGDRLAAVLANPEGVDAEAAGDRLISGIVKLRRSVRAILAI